MIVSDQEFEKLLASFESEAIHLETRDAYGTEVELPYMARWAAGEPDDLEWLQGWCATLREHAAADRVARRARIVSEPLSNYQRWSHSIAHPMVDAGEDIRWVPRRLLTVPGRVILLPANDFYVFDGRLVVFLTYAGNGLAREKIGSTDPQDIARCINAFESIWQFAVPHRDYSPI
ncbi:DUF6879 family protein [Nonomuraea basaltis]|uniref:DUF6879 family protein n=1 Tax=Nonomuraea basaltis TaxID=2495887 RepID=UPI001F0F37B8|nr:DUF6879 family protein [Nonomuraea basaltis]